jgi:hypothetical protein
LTLVDINLILSAMSDIFLCTIVKDISNDYMINEYCKHYSKYDFKKAYILIHSEINDKKRIDEIQSIFSEYFNSEFSYKIDTKYEINFESNFYTESMDKTPIGQWLFIADIDEFIEIEKINEKIFISDHVSGLLIDRVKREDHIFNPDLNIFENYSDNYFFYNKLKTSFPIKVPFIRKSKYKCLVGNGHHGYTRSPHWGYAILDTERIPVYHFKWREDSMDFLKKSINGVNIKDNISDKCWEDEINFMIKKMEKYGDKEFYNSIKEFKLKSNTIEVFFKNSSWPEKTTVTLV